MNTAHVVYQELPRTLDEAVEHLDLVLDPSYKQVIAETLKDDILDYHFGLGLMIRNAFKLHTENPDLLTSCGTADPGEASTVIIETLWTRLQGEALSL